ncbi:MAG TPA: hypothetical protein VG347_01490 [Verrucomicrobiae bacterium]|nr:hypothetical protein [Verrucomicrobiae bacterium]
MIPRKFLQAPAIDGITAGSLASAVGTMYVKPPARISKVVLKYVDGGSSPTDILSVIGDITCFKNNSEFRVHSAAQLDFLNQQNGTQWAYQKLGTGATQIQYLTIYFFEPWRKMTSDAESQCLIVDPSQGWNKDGLQIQIKLLAAIPSTGALTAQIYMDDLIPNTNTQQVCKIVKRQNIVVQGTEVDYLTIPQSGKLQGINLTNPSTTGVIKSLIFKANGVTYVDEVLREDMINHLTGMGVNPPAYANTGANQQSYSYVVDDSDPIQAALALAGANPWAKIKFTVASSGTVIALLEIVDTF